MTLYLISYDLIEPNRDYKGLFDELKTSNKWWHFLESTWIIKTSENADEIFERLKHNLDKNDNLLVIEAGTKSQGWLPPKAWDWIKTNR